MGYADLARARRLLKVTDGDDRYDDDLVALDDSLSRLLEQRLGRAWAADANDPPDPSTRPVTIEPYAGWLLLPAPVRLVTAFADIDGVGFDWSLDDETVVVAPDGVREYRWIRLRSRRYATAYTVTADWADVLPGPAPSDVREAVTLLVVGFQRRDEGGIVGSGEVEIGLDGSGGHVRDPWGDPRVRATVKAWTLPVPVVM